MKIKSSATLFKLGLGRTFILKSTASTARRILEEANKTEGRSNISTTGYEEEKVSKEREGRNEEDATLEKAN